MVKFIDVHAHCLQEACAPFGGKQPLHTAQQLLAYYDRAGIEKGVLLPIASPEPLYTTQSNEEALRIAKTHPGRFVPFCSIDPRNCFNTPQANLVSVVKHYRERGCKGIGEVCCNLHILDPRVQNLLHAANENEMAVTFHLTPFTGFTYGLVDDAQLPGLEKSLKAFAHAKFFGHSRTFWCEIGQYYGCEARFSCPDGKVKEGALHRLFRTYPNLYGDLSGDGGANALMRDRAHAVRFLTEFQDRLFFGTDVCAVGGWEQPLGGWLRSLVASGELSETVFEKVARANAVRILGL